jgi:hypothetical protein
MVQSTQHGFATHSVARRKPVPMLGIGRGWSKRGRYARSKAHMSSAMVVMQHPIVEKVLEVPLAQRDEEIQALPTDGSQHAFASGICLGRSDSSPQDPHAHIGNSFVQCLGEDAVRAAHPTEARS